MPIPLPAIHPEDRVLLLGIPAPDVVASMSRDLTQGLLVAMGTEGEVAEARRNARELDNVMFVVWSDAAIPWRDEFFTIVVDLVEHHADPAAIAKEIARVTAPGGRSC
jgi:SAM-dependent methyltransferase